MPYTTTRSRPAACDNRRIRRATARLRHQIHCTPEVTYDFCTWARLNHLLNDSSARFARFIGTSHHLGVPAAPPK